MPLTLFIIPRGSRNNDHNNDHLIMVGGIDQKQHSNLLLCLQRDAVGVKNHQKASGVSSGTDCKCFAYKKAEDFHWAIKLVVQQMEDEWIEEIS